VELALKDWTDRIFGRPVTQDHTGLLELEEVCAPDLATLLKLTDVFENAAVLLAPYSDESVDQAFWDLSGRAFFALREESIDWAARHRLIRSFDPLFREFFAPRCQPVLGHLSEKGSPLNSACYMWWDFDCWCAIPDPLTRNPQDSAFLASMRSILSIDHVACQESALHGLGHWHDAHPTVSEGIIDEFLKRERHLREELREYANAARVGYVQ
jgi:hypothetical protein